MIKWSHCYDRQWWLYCADWSISLSLRGWQPQRLTECSAASSIKQSHQLCILPGHWFDHNIWSLFGSIWIMKQFIVKQFTPLGGFPSIYPGLPPLLSDQKKLSATTPPHRSVLIKWRTFRRIFGSSPSRTEWSNNKWHNQNHQIGLIR